MSCNKSRLLPDDCELLQYISIVREKLEPDVKNNDYEEEDVDRLRKCDYEVRRYLYLTNMDIEKTISMIKDRLEWRKEVGLTKMRPETFPREFYECGSIFEFRVSLPTTI